MRYKETAVQYSLFGMNNPGGMAERTLFQWCPISCSDAMRLNCLAYLIVVFLSAITSCSAWADLIVVTGTKTGVTALSKEEVINIYLGRYRRLSNGLVAEPLDMAESSEAKKEFYWKLVEKTPAEINAYWARLIFSGQTRPPATLNSSEEITMWLLNHPGTIAYIERSKLNKLDKRLVILFQFTD